VQSVKFPPHGQRGLDGASIDNSFYLNGTKTYAQEANRETVLIVQIETPEALAEIDAIAAVPGVDGLFIGPGDLSLRLQCAMDWSEPPMAEAQQKVAAAAAKHSIAWGRPARSPDDIVQLRKLGGQLIAHGSDFSSVAKGLGDAGKNLSAALQ
jgi:4-hydroxy-2-oxoheptanedioate aldolase